MAYLSSEALAAMGFKHLGKNVRISDKASIYNADQIEIGDNSRVDDFCVLSGNIKMGRNTLLAVYSHLSGGRPGIEMQDFSTLAYGCQIFAQSDDYSGKTMTNPTIPAKYKQEVEAPIVIGKYCIIGTNSVITPGVHVGEGTSVGAMTLVNKSTEEWSILRGVTGQTTESPF